MLGFTPKSHTHSLTPLPWADVFIHAVSVEISRFGAVSTGEWVLPLPGVTAPVWPPGRFWLLGAGSRLASPLRSLAPLFSGVGAGGRQSPPCFLA